jgi:adenylate kinase
MSEIQLIDIIQIFAPPGGGKGTQAKILESTGLFKQISTGDLFSKIKQEMNPKELAEEMIYLDSIGEYYSDKLAVDVFRYELEQTDKIVIADGIPRTKEQVYMLNEFTNTRLIFNLIVPSKLCDRRMRRRAETDPNKSQEKDPTIREKRLITYHNKTEPLLELYDPHIIVDIDGARNVRYINKQIMDILYYTNFINNKKSS